jgi:cytoskeletal protein RodZ
MSDDFDPRAFGHRLRVTRIALGISEQEVAKKNSIRLR